ncbi:uncharacterized protein LAESUDRAFT_283178 [Laetiporus sulphureus 93-53]|uniref:Ubiquitin 3 binding protein But2 C-terminal domain-containing protein n=1 Tax=Laetiporus sulphureus 93-53 TaxID=1314785 RepID=A0A165DFC4_9APHY|nr:uncharacterized protein LAESUDRAFT_283178 [Laetiporus sulphureus 93-53]KZT04771.1 hypothetical protein LAESUDRAFT_283178 [Laetiporus sulphureus 93-53]
MGSYEPMKRRDLKEDVEHVDTLTESLLPGYYIPTKATKAISKWIHSIALLLSTVLMICSFYLVFHAPSIVWPHDVRGLRKPDQYPGLNFVPKYTKKGPATIFPSKIVRANKASPDTFYAPGAHVVLSDNDSMFYQWPMKPSIFKLCIIEAWVTPQDHLELLPPNKTWTASGNLSEIQIWNVTSPAAPIESMSWNTRPERISLLGTVAWITHADRLHLPEFEDGWQLKPPTPRFECGYRTVNTIEVACEGCNIEFNQVFSEPPLAFDLSQIG